MRALPISAAAVLLATIACSTPRPAAPTETSTPRAVAPAPAARGRVLTQLGDVSVVSSPPTGFDALTPSQRALAYHLGAAAWSSDPLFTMQSSRFALPAQRAVRTILARSSRLDASRRERLAAYRRLLFVYHGLHDHRTGQKYDPPLSRDEFERAARAADVTVAPALVLAMFDPSVEPMLVNKNPGPGKDPIVQSAASHYEGLTSKELETYREKFELNGRLRKIDGKIVEEVYRAGDARTAPGVGAAELRRVVTHLRAALPLAPAQEKLALERLVAYLETGERERMREHDVAWLAEAFPVDYVFGFLNTYNDVRQRKGTFMAFVSIPDARRNAPFQELARQASYFEQKLPFAPAYKRNVFRAPATAAVIAIAAAADAAPFTFGGMNLPDAQDLKETYGSKNLIVTSVTDIGLELVTIPRINEFAPPEVRAEIQRCLPDLLYTFIGLHEVTGHGSGKVSPSLPEDPSKVIGSNFGTLEEGRADLVADLLSGDPKIVDIGLLPDARCARVYPAYKSTVFLMDHLQIPRGDAVEEEHLRAAFIALGVFRDKGAISVEQRDGKVFFVVKDPDAWRRAAGELLAEHQRIKATGDKAAFEALVQKYGTRLDPSLRDQVVARNAALRLPKRLAIIPPMLTAIRDAAGQVVDAKAEQVTSLDAYIDAVEGASELPALGVH